MFGHQHYVPILKWKMGEYQALSRLDDRTKGGLTPLIEIPPIGYDFETGRERRSADDHLADFGKRLRAKWDGRRCFLDLKYVDPATRMGSGAHFVQVVFEDIRSEGAQAVPVVSLDSDAPFLNAVAAENLIDGRGVCVRLRLEDFDRPAFAGLIESLLRRLAVGWAEADLVVDFAAPNYTPIAAFVRQMEAIVSMIPALNRWRSFTIAGTSFPGPAVAVTPPFQLFPRREWEVYQSFVSRIEGSGRIPTFGDYATALPDQQELDMRIIKPVAKLRYTTPAAWHIARGTPVRTNGFGQYRDMCATVMNQPYFDGATFSAADEYIAECAAGRVPTGNLSTWVWVGTNRHLTRVVADLARFHGLSAAA